jgi:hypothetical protein
MHKIFIVLMVIMSAMASVSAQSATNPKRHSTKPGVVRFGPPTTYIKEGLTTEEVIRLLGEPVAVSQRNEKDGVVTVFEFARGGGRIIIAEFVRGALIHSRTETRAQVAQATW